MEIILLGLLCGALVSVWVFLETYNCFRLLSVLLWRSFASVLVLIGFLFGLGSAVGLWPWLLSGPFMALFCVCMDIQ